MSTQILLGVIDCGEWRVAQRYTSFEDEPDYSGFSLISILNDCSTHIYNNLFHCKFIATGYEDISESEKEYPTLSSTMGIEILTEIEQCDKYDTIPLIDNRHFWEDEFNCTYAFIVNYDTNKLTCYLYGNKFVFGEYDLNNLPSEDAFLADLKQTKKENIDEIVQICCKPMLLFLRETAIAAGNDPDDASKKYMDVMKQFYMSDINEGD